jgi:hypothetical protein
MYIYKNLYKKLKGKVETEKELREAITKSHFLMFNVLNFVQTAP